ncbi:DoxX family membrane protein [Streptomyces sp. RS10V-4]|uniref:DoxX family protein n=1 Tax=Streptomyces rhizoryzae TaxID=2932493 RepID=UPI002003B9B5|nr:DoxX family membrane protein [Streptomyces rhizoryzae]MCK7626744.1 DoxX family membrane protein [Streptomyces rhizoryzae]
MTTSRTSGAGRTGGAVRYAPGLRGVDAGLLLLRLVVGLTMAAHGVQKLFGWFGGPGLGPTGQYFAANGYPAGRPMALLAGLTETVGGLGLALGLLTPLAAAGVIGVMVNALGLRWGGGFFAPQGVEYEVVLLAAAGALALTGPGRWSLDRFLPGLRAHRLVHGVAAVVLGVAAGLVVLLVLRR